MIEVKSLKKQFGLTVAVDGIDCVFQDRSLTTISGASGGGKTTLLRMIGLMIRPTSGTVLIDGIDYFDRADEERALMRNTRIGFVFQDYKLDPSYSVGENLEIPLLIRGEKKDVRQRLVAEALERVGLSEKIKAKPSELSGGQQQRIAIARALINDPDIILADEPCGNLDEANKDYVYGLLCSLKEERTVIIVTHEAERIADADQKIVLNKGKICDGEFAHS